jgi:hypothetical protein
MFCLHLSAKFQYLSANFLFGVEGGVRPEPLKKFTDPVRFLKFPTPLGLNVTEQANKQKNYHQGPIMGIGFFLSILDDIGHFKRDDYLELTRWAWLQADRAHICIRVVEVDW